MATVVLFHLIELKARDDIEVAKDALEELETLTGKAYKLEEYSRRRGESVYLIKEI